MKVTAILIVMLLSLATVAAGQEYKSLPPAGIEIDPDTRTTLQQRVDALQAGIEAFAEGTNRADAWRPDVEVLVRAVDLALDQNLFFKQQEPAAASKLLDEAARRLEAARRGAVGLELMGLSAQVSEQPQLLVGGFVSRIDDSVQPFGLVVPAGFRGEAKSKHRVDVWLHGRGDTKTEVPFLTERMTRAGQYTPANTFVLHPFGRHCNAFKFAGETDVYEALDHLATLISVDQQQVSIRGFSMGGAGCWHLAVHDPGRWLAANPGAGFVDTIVYQGWDKQGFPFPIDATRQRLLGWYDVLPWVTNLHNTHTIAYSGEVDRQKQAADRVLAASQAAGIKWPYVIGKGMGHKIDAASAQRIDQQIETWASEPAIRPRTSIDFTTYTLRYSRLGWLQVTGLQQHFSPGRVQARLSGENTFEIETHGVTQLKIDFREAPWPRRPVNAQLRIDGQSLLIEDWDQAAGTQCELARRDHRWQVVERIDNTIRKRPGMQGPIDDAFCDRFVFVVPSRPARHGQVQRWIDRELQYAQDRWQRLMRGKVNVVRDTEVTAAQIEDCHLVCFGDFGSNRYLAEIAPQLPIEWTDQRLQVGTARFDPQQHVVAFCYPNPRNPERYLVVNSGMTYREFSNVSNSRQVAMLPDWAVMTVEGEDDGIFAGRIIADGFFDEQWQLGEVSARSK